MLQAWAERYGVSAVALAELQSLLTGASDVPVTRSKGGSEASVQALIRLEASQKGARLWRNNVGSLQDAQGNWVRFGLANDSPIMNSLCKSSDLIGINPRRITQQDVGTVIGQFLSREVKRDGWKYAGTPREVAQLRWIEIIAALGGDACFATSPGTIR